MRITSMRLRLHSSLLDAKKLTGGECRKLRKRWGIHRHHLADKARLERVALERFEQGGMRPVLPAFREEVHKALVSMIVDLALCTAIALAEPGDPRIARIKLVHRPRHRDRETGRIFGGGLVLADE